MRRDARRWPDSCESTSSLLWEACRREPDRAAVRRDLSRGADTALATAAAAEHRIAPLLWRALGVAGVRDAVGPEVVALKGMANAVRMEALLLLPRAVALAIHPLTAAGLEPVVFKGPAVAIRYPEAGLRPMDDIDLLLPPPDHAHAVDVLCAAGWRVARPGGPGHYDTALIHDDVPSLSLELHYALDTKSDRVSALDPGALWRRRQPIDCAGTPAFGLALVDELVVLTTHAGKPFHGFTRLVWIADLAMIVGDAAARGAPVDWERVHAEAEAARCLTVVGAALALARRTGVDAPARLFPLPARGRRGETMRQLLSVTWPLTHEDLHRYRLNDALTDSPAQRLKLLFVLLGSWHAIGRRTKWAALRLCPSRRSTRVPPGQPLEAGKDLPQHTEHG